MRLAVKNVSEVTYFLSGGTYNLTSVSVPRPVVKTTINSKFNGAIAVPATI